MQRLFDTVVKPRVGLRCRFWEDDGLLFHNPIREDLPTIHSERRSSAILILAKSARRVDAHHSGARNCAGDGCHCQQENSGAGEGDWVEW